MDRVVPCVLHLTMAITKLLLNLLAKEANGNAKLAEELQQRLESNTIKIKLIKSKTNKTLTFLERVKRSRLQRPEYLRIISNQEYLLEALDVASKKSNDQIAEVIVNCFGEVESLIDQMDMETVLGVVDFGHESWTNKI